MSLATNFQVQFQHFIGRYNKRVFQWAYGKGRVKVPASWNAVTFRAQSGLCHGGLLEDGKIALLFDIPLSQNTSIPFSPKLTISFFFFLIETKTLSLEWRLPFHILVEAIFEVPCFVLQIL